MSVLCSLNTAVIHITAKISNNFNSFLVVINLAVSQQYLQRQIPFFLVTLCAIWYHLYNLKNMKTTNGGGILLIKFQAEACSFTKRTLAHGYFSSFLNCTSSTRSCKVSHMFFFFDELWRNKTLIIVILYYILRGQSIKYHSQKP